MNLKRYLFPALLVGTGLALLLQGFAKPAAAKSAADNLTYDAIDAYVEAQMKRLNVPGLSLALVDGDQIVHLRGFGQARPGGDAPIPQTPFFIGSTTKSFTALAVMQLVEAGKIELDAPVQHYLPWFRVADPQASAQITVRQLLNQTSGIPLAQAWQDLADFDQRADAAERQARALATLELSHAPGAAFEYSNVNFNLLGLVIEAASGETYANYIQRHIFDPLEMRHSYTSKAAAQQDGLAVGHQTWFGFPVAVPDLPVPVGSLPSGQLISSAEDMGHYVIAQLNGGQYGEVQILSPEGIAELHHPAVAASSAGVQMGHYAMGWYVDEQQGMQVVHHTGMVPDFYTYMALLPEQKKGVVMLVNGNHFIRELTLSEIGDGVTALLAGEQPAPIELGFLPWVLRALLLVPVLQVLGVVLTTRRLRGWQQDPASRPAGARVWGRHIVLPTLLNLIPVGAGLAVLTSNLRGFWMLFMPDLSWLAMLCGTFAGVWTLIRTRLVLRTLKSE
ncbi:MAG: beta-lactamase family protein [Anaerolineales bacterium]|nr:beta-lactamase family protein [Anaerolineales bacterium]